MSNPSLETVHRHNVRVDVSGSNRIDRALTVTATVHLPPAHTVEHGATVVYALPGGGYSRGYFDMHFPSRAGYSQADHHRARGYVLVAIDHLGVGDSTGEVCDELRVEDIAAANHAAVQRIAEMLEAGAVAPGYPALHTTRRVGLGQSMGGAVTIVMQARHRTYDAVAVLGFSAIHTVLPFPDAVETADVATRVSGSSRGGDLDGESVAATAGAIPDFLYPFHWADVPADIVAADVGGGFPFRTVVPAFGSGTMPVCAVEMLSPGYVTEDAATLECPVFVGVGERDVVPTPLREPTAYQRSMDVTVFVSPQMAHMHNFASTRMLLWDRLTAWYAALPLTASPAGLTVDCSPG